MAVIGRATAGVVSLAILLVPAAVTPGEPRAPRVGTGWWEVSASAANVRVDHSGGDTAIGLAQSGDRVEVVDTWTSPLGSRWAKVLVTRTGVTGWVLWTLLTHREPHPEP
ncbi:SH3 domain-containing protein [Kitasatospora sp. NPDC101157]|uniref:SH3 domain-containing protein n=1 Tax=Kitasatospora sp. NPDC101157 TaxID=3364098 RepID=UPI00382F6066